MVRRQVTAFLPAPIGEQVDAIRTHWDPDMARRIAAHITLVHDAPDDVTFAAGGHQLLVRLTDVRCWGAPEEGIYLGVDDVRGDIARIRESLGVVEAPVNEPAVAYVPHVTLVHQRTVTPARLAEAWADLAGWEADATVTIDTIALVELRGSKWHSV